MENYSGCNPERRNDEMENWELKKNLSIFQYLYISIFQSFSRLVIYHEEKVQYDITYIEADTSYSYYYRSFLCDV